MLARRRLRRAAPGASTYSPRPRAVRFAERGSRRCLQRSWRETASAAWRNECQRAHVGACGGEPLGKAEHRFVVFAVYRAPRRG